MNKKQTLWIALPVFNEWPAIKELVENLLITLDSQFQDYQLVICDDGSTDEGKKYISSFDTQKNIKIIQNESRILDILKSNGIVHYDRCC